MSGKRAKALRRLAENITIGAPKCAYEQRGQARRVNIVDHQRKKIVRVEMRVTQQVSRKTTRGALKVLKKSLAGRSANEVMLASRLADEQEKKA